MEPRMLNMRCPAAVRFAAALPLIEASIGVIVVPTAEPKTVAVARSKPIQPRLNIINVIANVAADDCITMVTTHPTPKNISTDLNPRAV